LGWRAEGSFRSVWNAGIASAATTPITTGKFRVLFVNITRIWNRKQVIDPSCLLTEKLSERPLNYREQIMNSQPYM
jgi:predicted Rdx family selenoprotein